MKKRQRHISGFLLFILVSPILTCLTLLLYSAWIEHEMFERMELENLQVISLHPSEIKWKKENKELKIGSEYFDVKYAIRKSDRIEFHGMFDHKEKALEKVLNKSLSQNQNNNEKNNVFQFMQKLNFINTENIFPITITFSETNAYLDLIDNMYTSPSLNKTSPPPNRHFYC